MIDQLIQEMMRLDCQLLLAVNGLHAPYWDSVMYLVSDKYIWVPMYAMFLAVLLKNFSYKVVLTVLVTIGLIIDRKSTRLNSSHANISYAVFCLKKKKSKTRLLS